jgi:hypothetical protein
LPSKNLAPVDLAILGVALPDSRARFAEAVKRLRPRYTFPSHQDDFFRSLDAGFKFGLLTDFPRVLRDYKTSDFPAGSCCSITSSHGLCHRNREFAQNSCAPSGSGNQF